MIKSSRLRWAGHLDEMEEGKSGALGILTGKSTGKGHQESLGIEGRTILELIFSI